MMEQISTSSETLGYGMEPIFLFFLWNGFDKHVQIVSIIAVIFLALAFSWLLAKKRKKSLKSPPGPGGVPFLGNLPFLGQDLHSYFTTQAQIYSPVIKLRFGNKLGIVLSSPEMAREVLKGQDLIFANRDVPTVALTASYGGSDIVWSQHGPEWRTLRKVCVQKMLSNTTLDSIYNLRRKEIRDTVGYLHSRLGYSVNVGEQTFFTLLNMVTNMMWGGTLSGEARATLGAEFRVLVSEITRLMGKPNISDFYPWLSSFDFQGMKKKMNQAVRRFDEIFETVVDQRLRIYKEGRENDEDQTDFLQFLLKFMEKRDPKTPFTMTNLKALFMDMVVGGTDASSTTIEFTMAEILKNPEVMKKVQQELDQVIGKDTIVEESDIHKLPYLQAIVKECLRLHPPLPLLIPHRPSENCTVGGYEILEGSRVFINVWAIHRDPSNWEQPLEFKPERFMNAKWDFQGNDFLYLPFGSGRRICAGVAMAERNVLHFLATLLHSFDWKVPEGEKLDLNEEFGIVLKKKTPLMAIPTARLFVPALYQ